MANATYSAKCAKDQETICDLDNRRIFSGVQRLEIFVRAKGKCERCGNELLRGWHAHHIEHHADGGTTSIINGMALCERCHLEEHKMEKSVIDINDLWKGFVKDYGWQEKAVDKLMSDIGTFWHSERGKFERAFVAESSPSGGKSTFSMKCARAMIEAGLIHKFFTIVPRTTIKNGFNDDRLNVEMSNEYRILGDRFIRIDDELNPRNFGSMRNHHGAAINYQSLERFFEYARMLSDTGKKLLFIFDEIHHGKVSDDDGDECAMEWGRSILKIRSIANAVICMTGTPVRTDKKLVPFFVYDEVTQENERTGEVIDGLQVRADYRFTYADALSAGVARKLIFRAQDPNVEFTRDYRGDISKYSGPISGVEKRSIDLAKKHVFDRSNGIIDDMLKIAFEENEIDRKRGDDDAAILVVVGSNDSDGNNPLQFAKDRIRKLFGEHAVAVESSDDGASKEIRDFKKSKSRWIIAKDMISEGTSIPRLRTLLIFRDIKSEVRFQQLVHRITRNRSDTCAQDAKVVYVCLPNMREFAKSIEDEIKLIRVPEKPRCPNCDQELEFRPRQGNPCSYCGYEPSGDSAQNERFFEFEGIEFIGKEHVDQGGDDYSAFDRIARVVIQKLPRVVGGRHGVNEILRIAHDDELIDIAKERKEESIFTIDETVKRLWDDGYEICKRVAGTYARENGSDYQTAIQDIVGTCKRYAGFGKKNWQQVIREFKDPVLTMQKFRDVAKRMLETRSSK